jgi:DNA-binding response OmpR family regulator
MTILVADDQDTNRKLLTAVLLAEGYDVLQVRDGGEALEALTRATGPMIALLDWQMPVLAGLEVCLEARKAANSNLLFIILVTVRDDRQDIVAGLKSGANDYLTKPFDLQELLARVRVGARVLELQESLVRRVRELEAALAEINQLEGLVRICTVCKKVRDDGHDDYWQAVERYLETRTEARLSHGFCPDCFEQHLRPELESLGISPARIASINRPR